MLKKLFFVMAVLLSAHAMAQNSLETGKSKWRIGVSGGLTSNSYKKYNGYQSDWQQTKRLGATAGISGQYDLNDWFGLRADLMWTQKNYCSSRSLVPMEYNYTNDYIQLPVMASFSFGGDRVRGFMNVGVYGGYWIGSRVKGNASNIISNVPNESFSQSGMIDSRRDNRFVVGCVAGAGVEVNITPRWSLQTELRYYYDTTSQVKTEQIGYNGRYNSTLALQATAYYHF